MSMTLPLWADIVVSVLLVVSGVFALAGAVGLVRFKAFMLRMHAPALGFSGASWAVSLAITVYFTVIESSLSTHAWLIIVFLAVTVPITTLLLARAAQLRERQQRAAAREAAREAASQSD